MIIFLYGQDSYRSKQKLDEIINHYKASLKGWLNLIYIDADQADFQDFYNNFKVSAMFSEKKLIILKNLFLGKKFQESFLEELKKLEDLKDVIVVYESDLVDQRLKVFKDLVKNCKSQEFKLLDNKGLKIWAQKEFTNLNRKINADALDLLLTYVGNDLWRASNEIKKLSDFSSFVPTQSRNKGGSTVAFGEGGKNHQIITIKDVELLVTPKIEIDIFKTIDALAAKNKKQVFVFLQKHLDNGDNPLYLLSMVAYQFRNLLVVKDLAQKGLMYASIVQKSGLHPFVVKKNYFQCHQFSFEELKSIYQKIFQIDLDIKTGKVEPETALDLLVSQI